MVYLETQHIDKLSVPLAFIHKKQRKTGKDARKWEKKKRYNKWLEDSESKKVFPFIYNNAL